MATPIYDLDLLPAIEIPYQNEQEATKKYLGKKAITGQQYATLKFFIEDNAGAKALADFWRDDCNFGTIPFLAPLPIFGVEYVKDNPNCLVQFTEDFNSEKLDIHWKSTSKVKVLEYFAEVTLGDLVADNNDLIVDDAGNILFSTIVSETISNSNKEITL